MLEIRSDSRNDTYSCLLSIPTQYEKLAHNTYNYFKTSCISTWKNYGLQLPVLHHVHSFTISIIWNITSDWHLTSSRLYVYKIIFINIENGIFWTLNIFRDFINLWSIFNDSIFQNFIPHNFYDIKRRINLCT